MEQGLGKKTNIQLSMAKCISTGPVKSLCIVSIMQRWMSHICDISVTFNNYMWQGLYPVLTARIQSMYSNEKHIKGSLFGSRECLLSESKILTRRCFWELHRCARHVPFHCFGGWGVVVGGSQAFLFRISSILEWSWTLHCYCDRFILGKRQFQAH